MDKKFSDHYSYVEIINGNGTLVNYHKKPWESHLEDLQIKIEQLLGIKMENPQLFGAIGNFFIGGNLQEDKRLYVGEAAGFQDDLAGFGMILAIDSGYLAANSIMENKNYTKLCSEKIIPQLKASYVNHFFMKITTNWLINLAGKIGGGSNRDYRKILSRLYKYTLLHKLLFFILRLKNNPRKISGIESQNF